MFEVTVKLGDKLVNKYRGQGETTIGRARECGLLLDNLGVSRRHARLRHVAGRFIVEDENSTNGVFVNGRRIAASAEVGPDDEIQIGKFVLTLRPAREEVEEPEVENRENAATEQPVGPRPRQQEPPFVASITRDVFHRVDCNWIRGTPRSYKVFYSTEDEATRAGKRPCRSCLPPSAGTF
jgi:pSer/pThr/pTyr-binding forkhead associated (FHA) protein